MGCPSFANAIPDKLASVAMLFFDRQMRETNPANFRLRQDHRTSLWISDFNEFRDPHARLVSEKAIFQENRGVRQLIDPEFAVGARS
jgi:hypothetical protein